MRFIKALGLAAMSALAAMAFAGAFNASADTGCIVSVADSGECPAASRLAEGTAITASTPKATLTAEGLSAVECESSVSGKITKNDGPHTQLLGLITSLLFTNCKGGCTVAKAENLPYLVEALALTLIWHVKKDEIGNPAALLEHCTIFNVSCLYETASALLKFDPPGASTPAELLAENVPLIRGKDSELCPGKGTWNANYKLTAPNAGKLWLAALP